VVYRETFSFLLPHHHETLSEVTLSFIDLAGTSASMTSASILSDTVQSITSLPAAFLMIPTLLAGLDVLFNVTLHIHLKGLIAPALESSLSPKPL
jgi:hypothetical protein